MAKHVCTPATPVCSCYLAGDAPDEDCPIHGTGGSGPVKCECGRFVKKVAHG